MTMLLNDYFLKFGEKRMFNKIIADVSSHICNVYNYIGRTDAKGFTANISNEDLFFIDRFKLNNQLKESTDTIKMFVALMAFKGLISELKDQFEPNDDENFVICFFLRYHRYKQGEKCFTLLKLKRDSICLYSENIDEAWTNILDLNDDEDFIEAFLSAFRKSIAKLYSFEDPELLDFSECELYLIEAIRINWLFKVFGKRRVDFENLCKRFQDREEIEALGTYVCYFTYKDKNEILQEQLSKMVTSEDPLLLKERVKCGCITIHKFYRNHCDIMQDESEFLKYCAEPLSKEKLIEEFKKVTDALDASYMLETFEGKNNLFYFDFEEVSDNRTFISLFSEALHKIVSEFFVFWHLRFYVNEDKIEKVYTAMLLEAIRITALFKKLESWEFSSKKRKAKFLETTRLLKCAS